MGNIWRKAKPLPHYPALTKFLQDENITEGTPLPPDLPLTPLRYREAQQLFERSYIEFYSSDYTMNTLIQSDFLVLVLPILTHHGQLRLKVTTLPSEEIILDQADIYWPQIERRLAKKGYEFQPERRVLVVDPVWGRRDYLRRTISNLLNKNWQDCLPSDDEEEPLVWEDK